MIEIETTCSECGNPVDASLNEIKGNFYIEVEPCETCLQNKYEEGMEYAGE